MKLTILETTDIHSHISTDSFKVPSRKETFSMSRAKTYIDKVKEEKQNVIYIDNGDNLQGSPLATFYHNNNDPKNLADSYNLLGTDCIILGNHDFNYGQDYLRSYINHVKCPVLSANTIQESNNCLNIKPYTIKDIKDIRVGILGLVTQYIPHWENPKNIKDLVFNSALDTANYYVPFLRNKKNCDIIIISYHGGFAKDLESGNEIQVQTGENEAYDLLYSGLDFDILLTGHTHQEIAGVYNNIPVVQASFAGRAIAEITLEINENKKIINKESKIIDLSEFTPDLKLENHIKKDMNKVQKFLDISCGFIKTNAKVDSIMQAQINGHPYINLINQIQMEYAGVDIAATPIFTIDTKGFSENITMRDIINNYIFNNTLMKLEITGKDLKQILEFNSNYFMLDEEGMIVQNPEYFIFNYDIYSGIEYTYDYSKDIGHRLTSIKYHGHYVKDDQKITFATNNYRAIGGGDFPILNGSQIIWESSEEIPELIFDYIKEKKEVTINNYPTVNTIGYKGI